MKHRILAIGLVVTALVTSACAVPVGSVELPGLQALQEEAGLTETLVSGRLRALADQAEADAPLLDVVQIEYSDAGNVTAFVILKAPEQDDQSEEEYAATRAEALRTAVEALWGAALEHTPEAPSMAVAFMRLDTVTTLDRGQATVAWLVAGVIISLQDAAGYLQGERSPDSFRDFWNSDAVTVIPVDELYAGTPNHPVRFLETQA